MGGIGSEARRAIRRVRSIWKGELGRLVAVEGRLEFVQADLEQDAGWDAAMAGAKFVLHVASPIPEAPPKDENDLIRPARDGSLRVLRAASQAGVQRVVLTSSIAAIAHGHVRDGSKLFDERDWSDPSQGDWRVREEQDAGRACRVGLRGQASHRPQASSWSPSIRATCSVPVLDDPSASRSA